ncbi:mechanosensitive ion channel family protein [Algibacter mikhailovii]|uniref:mechanosensitive ion channel family protein n=1 Tax=Algibacter mikhailovii TaxID=425498 RepID=UPI002494413B|nr:mechanosensitive ion channel domain-containing protein [Algibacter mikhailovii]
MNNMYYFFNKKSSFLSILFFFILSLGQSQTVININEQDLRKTPIDSIDFEAVRLTAVLKKASEDLFMLDKLIDSHTDTTTVQELNQSRKERIDAYRAFTKDKLHQDISSFSNRELENVDRQWSNQKDDIESIIGDYLVIIDRLEEEKKSIQTISKFWEKYRAHNSNSNAELIEDLNNTNKQISLLLPKYENKIDILAKRANSLNRINIEIDDKLERINDYLNSANNLFKQNIPPYWNTFTTASLSLTSTSFLESLKNIYDHLKETARNFISTHFLVACIFLFFYALCIRIKKRLQFQTDFIETHRLNLNAVFNRPFLAAYFYTYIFAYFIYLGSVPAIFIDFVSLGAVIALFIISKTVFDKIIVSFIKHFMVFWISMKIVEIFETPSFISRTILLLISAYFLYWLYHYYKKKQLQGNVKTTFLAKKLLSSYLILAIVLTVTNIICTVLGYMNLALYVSAFLVSMTLLIIFLYLWNPLFKRFILLAFDENYLKSRRFINDNKEAILKSTSKIINLGTYAIFIYSLLSIISLFNPIVDWVDTFINNEITIGSLTFSLWSIILFVVIIALSTFLSKVIQLFLQDEVLVKANLERGFPETISMLVKYLIAGVGYFIAITTLGIELSQMTIIFGALSVGIGFGLQNIFNNLVSGLILIFSRPIRIDDTIEINDMVGRVNSIGIRSSHVRTFEGAEVIIPNGNLISNEVINWTLSDQRRRIEVMIGVAYGSNIKQVSELLQDILNNDEQVINFPEPLVLFDEFADSSLNFKLLFWTGNIGDWMIVKSNVLFEINAVFEKENIEIPFPQRDIHMISE